MKHVKKRIASFLALLFALVLGSTSVYADNVKGVVLDENGEPMIGATVALKETPDKGVITDFDGAFSITVPNAKKAVLVVQYIGYDPVEVQVKGQSQVKVVLKENTTALNEVVVVGYGQQKKASVVGAITQTTGEVLERAAGIGSVGAALTGNLPGVVTMTTTGQPGEEDPRIIIRGAAAWNQDAQPLILVDGIRRPIQSVDITSVATISVLKDASATAVYGVEGANGVILITTKRGQEGKAKIDIGFIATLKTVSKLPRKYDSYDGYMYRNQAIENELAINGADSWAFYRSQTFINNFRNQDYTVKPQYGADGNYIADYSQAERYPNVDWQDALFKTEAMSYNTNLNIMGGTKFVKYFVAFDMQNEGDLTRIYDNHRGYEGGWSYNRLNVRSNLDFQITNTTVLKVNLAGSNSIKKAPRTNSGDIWQEQQRWAGAYNIAPNVFIPQYSDGSWGYYPDASNVSNSIQNTATAGLQETTDTRISTDFMLEQKLDFITKGLTARATISWDNVFTESGRGISDYYNDSKTKFIRPETGTVTVPPAFAEDELTGFDWANSLGWSTGAGSLSGVTRNMQYSAQLYWARQFGNHNLTAMGTVTRRENNWGANIPDRREDWVFRVTYDFKGRYFAEYNGAYNGSQKFSSENRFAFFSSGALGWMVTEEPFMKWLKEKKIVDMFKIRGSYGEIGDDNAGVRWGFMTQWATTGKFKMDLNQGDSPYTGYRESVIGNNDIRWAVVAKKNIGFDYSFLGGMFAGSFDWFRDDRRDVFISGKNRTVPAYFGGDAPDVNKGKMKNEGFEVELRFNKVFKNGIRVWANTNMTHARNEIILKDDADLMPEYRKEKGYAVNQCHSYIDAGFISTYDQLLGAPNHDANDNQMLIGDHYIVDFNGDGIIDSVNDLAPYAYSAQPENSYNATVGFEYKGFSMFAQLYGVSNVTRDVGLTTFAGSQHLLTVFDTGTWWNTVDQGGDVVVPRWNSQVSYNDGTQFLYDGSYVRLKNVEIAYTWHSGWIKQLGLSSVRIYLNGNNLWLWTKMPDDRESNTTQGGVTYGSGGGAYPTVKRYNLGIKVNI